MKISVTGATGHIGTNLIPELLKLGHQVRILLHNGTTFRDFNRTEIIHGDIMDKTAMENFAKGSDVVIHLAARISIERKSPEALKVNLEGTRNILNASMAQGIRRFIHFSSIHSLKSKPLDQVLDEDRELNLNSAFDYDRSKAEGEKMVMAAAGSGIEVIVLNPTAIVGPYDRWPSLLGRAIINLYKGKIPALVDGGYDWVDVRDVVQATIATVSLGRPGEKYMLSGHWKSMRELAESIAKCGGARAPAFKVPFPVAMAGAGLLNFFLQGKERLFTPVSLESLKNSHKNISHDKATKELNYTPRPFDVTIADTIDWFKKNDFL